ncbi:MAG TPA: lipid-A-disaccharide synthase [Rhizobiaceae bacterium]|nr:lipid-A-disaccharide synthase [Rhizobiaceae bacterium]
MNASDRPLKIAVVAGEESGDLLGADLVRALAAMTGRPVHLMGVGGRHLQELGMKSLFPPGDIALMGVSAVIRDLPRLVMRIGQTARFVASQKPDCLITVDSPDFNLRVARKVRDLAPEIPIAHYVCPSVWAWRPGRASAMRPHVDRVLCLLPFEPAELDRLGGPIGTYVGHRLTTEPGVASAAAAQAAPRNLSPEREKTLLVLPGSRRGEVRGLIGVFRETISILLQRGNRLRLLLPTVPHVASIVSEATSDWPLKPRIILDSAEKWRAFGEADAALIASGTVSLELALSGVPMLSCYRIDPLMRLGQSLITVWSGSLPNLIADRAIVTEFYEQYIRPANLARQLEGLMGDTSLRAWQKEGFAEVVRRMATDRPAGEIAANAVVETIASRVSA